MSIADDIHGILEEQASCWNRCDLDGYLSYYAEDAIYIPCDGEFLHGVAAIGRCIGTRYEFATRRPGRLTYRGIFSRLVCPDLAIAAGRYRVEGVEPGRPSMLGRFSMLLRYRNRKWEIVLDHPA